MGKLVRFSISIDEDLVGAFDRLSHEMGYSSRSEAVRDTIRQTLIRREWDSGDDVAGVVTILYDHHHAGLSEAITRIQHNCLGQIISSTHVHIDKDNCLEFIAVKGKGHELEKLANRLISLKGVKHGQLTGTSTGKRIN